MGTFRVMMLTVRRREWLQVRWGRTLVFLGFVLFLLSLYSGSYASVAIADEVDPNAATRSQQRIADRATTPWISHIYNVATEKCIDLPGFGAGHIDGPVNQYTCGYTNDDNQRFSLVQMGWHKDTYPLYRIESEADGLCLDLPGAGQVDAGARVSQSKCQTGVAEDNQLFYLVRIRHLTYLFVSHASPGLCLDVAGERPTDNDVPLTIAQCDRSNDDHLWATLGSADSIHEIQGTMLDTRADQVVYAGPSLTSETMGTPANDEIEPRGVPAGWDKETVEVQCHDAGQLVDGNNIWYFVQYQVERGVNSYARGWVPSASVDSGVNGRLGNVLYGDCPPPTEGGFIANNREEAPVSDDFSNAQFFGFDPFLFTNTARSDIASAPSTGDSGIITVRWYIPEKYVNVPGLTGVGLGDNRGPDGSPGASYRVTLTWDPEIGKATVLANHSDLEREGEDGPEIGIAHARPVVLMDSAEEVASGDDHTNYVYIAENSGPEVKAVTLEATVSLIDAVTPDLPRINGTVRIKHDPAATPEYTIGWIGNGYPAMEAYYYRRYDNIDPVQTIALRDKEPGSSILSLIDRNSWATCDMPSPVSMHCDDDALSDQTWTTSWERAFEPEPGERATPDSGLPIIVNASPVPALSHSVKGLTVDVDASGSTDEDGDIASYRIDFGDGTAVERAVASHTYTQAGKYKVTLTVTDDDGATESTSAAVYVDVDVDNTDVGGLAATGMNSLLPITVGVVGMFLVGAGITLVARRSLGA